MAEIAGWTVDDATVIQQTTTIEENTGSNTTQWSRVTLLGGVSDSSTSVLLRIQDSGTGTPPSPPAEPADPPVHVKITIETL